MSEGPLFQYRQLRRDGAIKADSVQELAAEKLQSLHNALKGYRPEKGGGGLKARLGLARRRQEPPQGLYLYGGVGRGKSMLMDLFFEEAPVERKRRTHFHEFMLEVHNALHARRKAGGGKSDDPLPKIAAEVAKETWLLCFDEFFVTDIADAMILARLFGALFDEGVVVVATSNWPPDELYKDGLQRERFLPFIDILKERLDLLHLSSETDYRMLRLKAIKTYWAPLGAAASKALAKAFADLTDGARAEPETVEVRGRTVAVAKAARGVALVDFHELCQKPRGAEDYLGLARAYHTIVLDGVPRLSADRRNEAKRFMTLIDALYEHRCNLIMAADADPPDLYREGTHAFEFERTVSRLNEMQSAEYRDLPHRDAPAPGEDAEAEPESRNESAE
ncbi:AFG1 family ATPase [Marivibrio halodurans]|uniref:AFG1 family ATPase n=1 Tax=Marivibrio halodurans TaxID=2039722 RepID=A0A8J7V036_9PROT|nr:cell division protein ZapE [Marivibrio halodurans]MBP5856351.1 AFG1 family ATPase [Marivibrio halodurans]